MVIISLREVISYSSQDVICTAENLLRGSCTSPWLCSPDDKSGRMVAEFLFMELSRIDLITVGSCGAGAFELLVGKTSLKREYVSFLPCVRLVTPEVRRHDENCNVFKFDKKAFNAAVAEDQWDTVRIIVTRPFRERCQFGLTFLTLSNDDPEPQPSASNNAAAAVENHVETSIFERYNLPPVIRDIHLNAANERVAFVIDPMFEDSVNAFLISFSGEVTVHRNLKDYMLEFGVQRQKELTPREKLLFSKAYFQVFNKIGTLSEGHRSHVLSSESKGTIDWDSVVSSSTDILAAPLSAPEVVIDSSEANMEENEVQICSSSGVRIRKISRTPIGSNVQVVTVKRSSSPDSNNNNEKRVIRARKAYAKSRPSEVIAIDDNQPSTSSGFTFAECPICRETFTTKEIETHAATCGDGISSTVADLVYCPVCGGMFSDIEVNYHIDNCIGKRNED